MNDSDKQCSHCRVIKARAEFGRDVKRPDGLNPQCRTCKNERQRARMKNDERARALRRENTRRWRAQNIEHARELNREQKRRARAANPERERANARNWRAANKDRARRISMRASLKHHFGLTLEAYENQFDKQKGLCAICGQLETSAKAAEFKNGLKALAVDHDHVSGALRELLCMNCNFGIGNFKESPERLRVAAEYIKRWRR